MANPPLDQAAINQRTPLTKDSNGTPLQMAPAVLSLQETYDATVSSTTQVTFNASTTMIEVAAIDKAIMMKWGTSAATTADFDHVILANTVRMFPIPVNATTGVYYTAANFIEQAATAILAVSEF